EVRRDAGARKTLPDDLAIRLETRRARQPERTRGGDREEVREEVARLVHDLDPSLAVRNADVNMQAEDQKLSDHVLHLVLADLVAVLLGDLLVLPVRERMRPRGRDPETDGAKQAGERAAQPQHLFARLAYVRADLRPDLDDGLQP